MITPEGLKSLLKQHHWSMTVSKSGRQHAYAAKKRCGNRFLTRYIGTTNKLNSLTEETIVAKLQYNAISVAHPLRQQET